MRRNLPGLTETSTGQLGNGPVRSAGLEQTHQKKVECDSRRLSPFEMIVFAYEMYRTQSVRAVGKTVIAGGPTLLEFDHETRIGPGAIVPKAG